MTQQASRLLFGLPLPTGLLLLGALSLACTGRAAATESQYSLGPQDRVKIHVYEWPALTGEFTISSEGSVSLPLIGDITAAGLQTTQLANLVSSRLKDKAGLTEPPSTAIGVVQYRPFYIIGGVERAGEYSYRPGMLVLNAMSIAGGLYRRPETSTWTASQDRLRAEGEAQALRARRSDLLARQARLQAELAQQTKPATNPKTSEPAGGAISEGERSMLNAQRDRQQNEVRALQQSVTLLKEEIVSLKAQYDAAEKQRLAVQREVTDTRDYIGRGLAPTNRLMPLERTVAQIEREQKEMDTQVLRAKQQINAAERTMSSLADERTVVIIRDLLEVQTTIHEMDKRILSAERIIQAHSAYAGEAARSSSDAAMRISYTIVRTENSQPREFDAEETTPMKPGDILKVQLLRDDTGINDGRNLRLSQIRSKLSQDR
ncbi:polysaccharide biosynthesis/export family protein [Methylobacterium sp. NEAU 140]|uniref:polysaccharide biosynthesis/export family protein n=1 Tax=Methylobacterium sp. NEAU 140 TaxID=3064945 RepID=UPI0027325B6C|nr:polysaccharide biosynthesis/export family protein [Methylobacterium sp. NEAU 140]MDP4023752.1 polysaccharide biosynthesis/export family protein [Methylobacterium sp. NEAU 140]